MSANRGAAWRRGRVAVLVGLAWLAAVVGEATALGAAPGAPTVGPAAGPAGQVAGAPFRYQHSWVANYQVLGYYAARERGYYGAEGLDVEVVLGGPRLDPVEAIVSGAATVGEMDAPTVAAARAEGQPLVVLAARYQRAPNAIICRADRVGAPGELVGKRVGVTPKDRAILEAALALVGVEAGRVEIVETGVDLAPLVAGDLDCRHGFISNEAVALELAGVPARSFLLDDLGLRLQGGLLVAREDTARAQRDAIARFLRASARGWEWAIANPEAATALLAGGGEAPPDLARERRSLGVEATLMSSPLTARQGLLALDVEAWRSTLAILWEIGVLRRPVTVDELLDLSALRPPKG